MSNCVYVFIFSLLVTFVAGFPESRPTSRADSVAESSASSTSDTSTGFSFDNNYGVLAGAFASFSVDPSFTGTISAQASLTFRDGLHAYPPGVGGYVSSYAGGYPGFQAFPTFQPMPYLPPRFSPIPPLVFPAGGHAAGASATIGGGQAHQTAYLSPENPASPNVDIVSRFSDSGTGVQGISSYASSSSTNINGKETVHREAGTTVNDNGKITSYHVKD